MRLKAELYRWSSDAPAGTVEWDSETGALGGSLAREIALAAAEAQEAGRMPAGAQFAYEYPADDPLHKPDQFAALLQVAGFVTNRPELAELMSHYQPKFGDPFETVPELKKLSRKERAQIVF